MIGILDSIFTFLSSSVVRFLSEKVLLWGALKALLVSLFLVVMPLALNNFTAGLMEDILSGMNGLAIPGSMGATVFSGFLGWLVDCFNITEIVSITISAIQARIVLACVPFSPFK